MTCHRVWIRIFSCRPARILWAYKALDLQYASNVRARAHASVNVKNVWQASMASVSPATFFGHGTASYSLPGRTVFASTKNKATHWPRIRMVIRYGHVSGWQDTRCHRPRAESIAPRRTQPAQCVPTGWIFFCWSI